MKREKYIINDKKWDKLRKEMRKDIREKGLYGWLKENVNSKDEESMIGDMKFVHNWIKGNVDNRIIVKCIECGWSKVYEGIEGLRKLGSVKCCGSPDYDWSYCRNAENLKVCGGCEKGIVCDDGNVVNIEDEIEVVNENDSS